MARRSVVVAIVLLLAPIGAQAQAARGQIAGRTVDESGAPIRDALVTLRPSKPAASSVELEVMSDDSGAFEFDRVPAGAYRVAAHLSGFYPPLSTIQVSAGRRVDVALVMAVAPIGDCEESSPVAIEFKTRTGDQLPEAYLTVARGRGRARSYGLLPNGRLEPCFSPAAQDTVTLDVLGYGEYRLKRAGEAIARLAKRIAIDPTTASRNGRTKPGPAQGQIRGRVFDVYGASIPDPTVLFQPVDPSSGLAAFGAQADARGRFDFAAVRTGTYRVTSRARGYETSVAVHEVKPGVENEVTLVLRAVK
jgi:hypothetical protein